MRAQVIQIAPRVSDPIVKLPIKDNQLANQPALALVDVNSYWVHG